MALRWLPGPDRQSGSAPALTSPP